MLYNMEIYKKKCRTTETFLETITLFTSAKANLRRINIKATLKIKMKHFDVIKFVNIAAAIIFFVMGVFLAMAFTFNMSVVDELQQAANFDKWKIFILLAAIVSFLASITFVLGSWKEFLMSMNSSNSVAAETIYILGLGIELERPKPIGVESPSVASGETSRSSSMVSIFGFGHGQDSKWTFAGRKPLPRQEHEKEDAGAVLEDGTGKTKPADDKIRSLQSAQTIENIK